MFIGTDFNLQMNLLRTDVLRSFPVHDHDISLFLYRPSLISLSSVLNYQYTSLVKFTPKYFIFFNVTGSGIVFFNFIFKLLPIHRNKIYYCMLILYSTLQTCSLVLEAFLQIYQDFLHTVACHFQIMRVFLSISILYTFSFFYLAYHTGENFQYSFIYKWLNRTFSQSQREVFSLSPLSMMLTVGF